MGALSACCCASQLGAGTHKGSRYSPLATTDCGPPCGTNRPTADKNGIAQLPGTCCATPPAIGPIRGRYEVMRSRRPVSGASERTGHQQPLKLTSADGLPYGSAPHRGVPPAFLAWSAFCRFPNQKMRTGSRPKDETASARCRPDAGVPGQLYVSSGSPMGTNRVRQSGLPSAPLMTRVDRVF